MTLEFPPFRPYPLLAGGHLQTIAGAYLPGGHYPYRAAIRHVPLADGDQIALHDDRSHWSAGDPVAILIHGLGGCYQSTYMERCAAKLAARGLRVFRMDLRGCGAGFALAKHPLHAGRSDDAAAVLDYVRKLCPGSPIHMAGFSMGANILVKMAGEMGAAAPPELVSLFAVSPPIDLVECSRNIRFGRNRMYDRRFVKNLLAHVRRRERQVPGALTRPLAPRPLGLLEFDDRFTAPLSGFAGVQDYYERASSAPVLRNIARPTLIVAAATDPIVPIGPFERASYSATTRLVITPCGGHLGFVGQRGSDPDRRWLDWRLIDWIEHHQGVAATSESGRQRTESLKSPDSAPVPAGR
ncbi:MAG: alpha/beta fold hydrolase [Pirellulaceae bacterium]|nr:alpha/beta fold hydrolase [Pirellulaceae bacterium]